MKGYNVKKFSVAIIFSSLFVVLSFVPIGTSFIGGKEPFALSIVLPPVIGWLLGPYYGVFSVALGFTVDMFFLSPPFGLLGLIIPVSGALFSGLNKRKRSFFTAAYLLMFSFFFSIIYPVVWWFVLPHIVGAFLSIFIPINVSSRIGIFLSTFSSTFSQQATGTVLTILLLQLRADIYYFIFPIMIYERAVASVGAFLIIFAVQKRLRSYAVLQ